jgi:hypothetical protein
MYRNTQSGALQDIDKNKFLLRGSINRQAVTEYPLEHLTYQEVLLLLLRAEEFSGRD